MLLSGLAGHPGCSRQKPVPEAAIPATPFPPEEPPRVFPLSREAPPVIAHEISTPAPVPSRIAAPAATPLPDSLQELEKRYLSADTPPEEKREIIAHLGRLENPQAIPVLDRIFTRERRLETRMEVLEVVADLTDDSALPAKIALLSRAIAPTQSITMRLSAMTTLADLDDPKVLPLLRALARDPSQVVRQNAARILAEKQ